MKSRNRVLSAGVGIAMLAGSMLMFTGTANATPGDLAVAPGSTITLGGIVTTLGGAGTGSISGSTRTGNLALTGAAAPCFAVTVSVPTDTVSWDANNTGTEDMTNAVITIDSTSCTLNQGVCVVTLNGTRTLKTAVGGFPGTTTRVGTFTEAPGTQVGSYTIREGTNCLSSGLAGVIAGAFGAPAGQPTSLPYTNSSTTPFSASLGKTLTIV